MRSSHLGIVNALACSKQTDERANNSTAWIAMVARLQKLRFHFESSRSYHVITTDYM
jgi:hypothetical protein